MNHSTTTSKLPRLGFGFLRATLVIVLLASCSGSQGESSDNISDSRNTAIPNDSVVTKTPNENDEFFDCPQSTRELPIKSSGEIACGPWTLTISSQKIGNEVVEQIHPWNDTASDRSWIVVTVKAKFNGDGVGDLNDQVLWGNAMRLIGSSNTAYEDKVPTGNITKFGFSPHRYDANDPYSGGEVTATTWFWTNSDDSDFVLALRLAKELGNVPNVWISL